MGLVAAAGAVCIAATSCRWQLTRVLSPCFHWDAVLVCQKIHHVKLRQLHMYCIFLPVLCISTVTCKLEVLHSKLTGMLLTVRVSSLSGWSFAGLWWGWETGGGGQESQRAGLRQLSHLHTHSHPCKQVQKLTGQPA